jgi:hypothetical protein
MNPHYVRVVLLRAKARLKLGWPALAGQLGVGKATLCRWRNGGPVRRKVWARAMGRLKAAAGVLIRELDSGRPPRKVADPAGIQLDKKALAAQMVAAANEVFILWWNNGKSLFCDKAEDAFEAVKRQPDGVVVYKARKVKLTGKIIVWVEE